MKVRLRVLIPGGGKLDLRRRLPARRRLPSRKGITVEIGNTDAEGRLILADALALPTRRSRELMVDMATLTGAARVALGPDLPPFYTDDARWPPTSPAAGARRRRPALAHAALGPTTRS